LQAGNKGWPRIWHQGKDPKHTHQGPAKVRIMRNAGGRPLLHPAFVPKEEHPSQYGGDGHNKEQQKGPGRVKAYKGEKDGTYSA